MTLTISNDCGEYVLTEEINILNAGIETENLDQAKIYPNPANSFVTIELDNASATTVLIMDATGREVKTLAINQSTTIAVEDWSKGVYFCACLNRKRKVYLTVYCKVDIFK